MIFDELIDALAQNGWQIRRRDEICLPQSEFLGGRFKNLSENFYRFVCSFEILSDAADVVWFVSARDYASSGADEAEFCYGDFEKDSLECAANDAERAAVSAFWSGCLPFLFSVRGERCFAGILTQGADASRIVFGAEPIYEDALIIAQNFEELIAFSSLRSRTKALRNIRFLVLRSGMRYEQSGIASASKTAAGCR